MPTAEEAAAANLAWRAVNAPSTISSSEQAKAAQYRQQYYTVDLPAQQARDAQIQQTILLNRQMINRQESWDPYGSHTEAQLRAVTGSAAAGRQAYENERAYFEQNPSSEYERIVSQYNAMKSGTIVTAGGAYAATGELQLSDPSEEAGGPTFSGRAAEYKAAYDREVFGIGAPDNEQEYYKRQALQGVTTRPGYTPDANLGDLTTQKARAGYGAFSDMLALQGIGVASDSQMTGRILESQRQMAYATPERRDERFFMGELQKWGQGFVETSSAYHDIGMRSGRQIPANPFEYQADLAVELLKGSPTQGKDRFSPVSGELKPYLPNNGEGLQGFAWREAITDYKRQNGAANTPYPERVSFMSAVEYVGAAEGKYGPYGKLWGGIDNGGVSMAVPNPAAVPAAQVFAGGAKAAAPQQETTFEDVFGEARSQAIGFANILLPGASNLIPSVKAEQRAAAGSFNTAIAAGDFGGAYTAAEKYFFATSPTRAMPDIARYDTNIRIEGNQQASDILTFGASAGKAVYTNVRENPLQTAGLAALPGAFSIGEAAVGKGVAFAAMSKAPGVSMAGRSLSTPLAADIGKYGIKGGMAALYGYESGMSVLKAEGAAGKGAAVGNVVYQVGAMSAGVPFASTLKFRTPENVYAGREFFSGKTAMSPVEKTVFAVETYARGFVSANRGAYLDVSVISRMGRFEEPMRRASPAIEETSVAGPYARPIRSVMAEQEHSMIGSSTVRQQYPTTIANEFGLRKGKDVDVLFSSPKSAIAGLSQRTGLSEEAAKGVMDVHPIPRGYPRFKPSAEVDIAGDESSFLSRVLGDPYRRIATPRVQSEVILGKEYGGGANYEAVQVQYGRKAAAVSAVIEDPITKGYRAEKDIYDFVGLYRAQRKVAITRGASPADFTKSDLALERFMDREITIGTTKGQKPGDVNPTRKVSMRQLFEEGKAGATERAAPQFEPEKGYVPSFTRSSALPSRGLVSLFGSSVAPVASSMMRPSPGSRMGSSPRSPASSASRFGSSFRSPSPRSPASPPGSIFISPPGPSRLPPSGPMSPPTSTTTRTPPFSPPSTPRTPHTTTSPPSPPRMPPSAPPSSPPYSPPTRTPPITPPDIPKIPGGFLPGGGGSAGGRGGLGVTRWQRDNLVATADYLGRGMRDPFGGSGKKRRRKNPFGF